MLPRAHGSHHSEMEEIWEKKKQSNQTEQAEKTEKRFLIRAVSRSPVVTLAELQMSCVRVEGGPRR